MDMQVKNTIDNGVNVAALLGARDALTKMPEAAKFQWRAESSWIKGTHSKTKIDKYFGLGEEHAHKQSSYFDSDHPEVFASQDNGPTPVEYLLVGLAGCLTAGIAAVAQHREIQLHSVKAKIEADMDIQGILGMDDDVRNGFESIKVTYEISADADEDDIEAIIAQSQKRSAVFDALTNPTLVTVVLA